MFQLLDILFFLAFAIAVAELMEAWTVVHFRQVGELMADDVVAQVSWEKRHHVAQADFTPAVAASECAVAI